jgi:hypothetical protein
MNRTAVVGRLDFGDIRNPPVNQRCENSVADSVAVAWGMEGGWDRETLDRGRGLDWVSVSCRLSSVDSRDVEPILILPIPSLQGALSGSRGLWCGSRRRSQGSAGSGDQMEFP